ncbi:MAG: TonB-dependent receptor, partial [Blastocatellia bacterium]
MVDIVAGGGVAVNTETQTIAEVIDSRKVTELPSLTRNPYAFVITVGNVTSADPTGRGVGVSINGQRAASTNVLLDGAANNDEFVAGVGQGIPLDSVQEYSVITNNFTAEYGRATGGIVNLATKSGTNNFHGTAYHFGRYSALASNSFQNNANDTAKSVFTRNQFGYSVGGPVVKDKLHFFQSTEWTRIRSTATNFVVVPTPQFIALADAPTKNFFSKYGALKSGLTTLRTITRQDLITAGSDPCAAGSVCATRVTPATPMFTRLSYDVPSDSGGGAPQNAYSLVGRMDWNISDKTQVYGRYALERSSAFDGVISNSPYQGFDTGLTTTNNNVSVSLTHTISSNLVSQSKLVYNRLNTLQPQGAAVPTLFWRDNTTTRFLGTRAALPGYLPFSPGSGIPFGGPQNVGQVYEDMSYTKGSHSVRFGGSYVYIQDNRTFGAYQDPSAGLSTATISAATNNFLLGQLARFQGAIDPQGKFPGQTVTLPVKQPNFS